jgi:hypothetical protein
MMTPSDRPRPWLRALAGAALLALGVAAALPGRPAARPSTLPEFKHTGAEAWINSAPLTKAGLRGKVVLLEVYTSG